MSSRPQRPFRGAELFGSFWLGTLTAAAFAYATFGEKMLSPRHGGFESVVLGVLTAAMLALELATRLAGAA